MAIPAMQGAAMLWTGGKDSSLALYEARKAGYDVHCLVTFAPLDPEFLAHPMDFIRMQAEALALPHFILCVNEPFERGYETALCRLQNEMNINVVITGDIAEVDGRPNWIRERCRAVKMQVHTPLWGRDRLDLLQQLLTRGFKAIFSCVNTRWLTPNWVGRALDHTAIAELRRVRAATGLDLCGEEGEYHTLVTDGPSFSRAIRIGDHSIRTRDLLAYLDIHQLRHATQ